MPSLEETIKKARSEILNDDGEILTIDRSASRKRKGLAILSSSSSTFPNFASYISSTSSSSSPSTQEIEFWKGKYDSLRKLRLENEEELEKSLEISKQRESKLEHYITLLERQAELRSGGSGNNKITDIVDMKLKIENQSKLIQFYEKMTAMNIKVDEKNDNKYICTVKNKIKRSITRFAIEENSSDLNDNGGNNENEISYIPMANIDNLPEYLQEEIVFEKSMGPVLLGDVLTAMFSDDRN